MYAVKVELDLKPAERIIMARHAGFARFCYNYALDLYNSIEHKEFTGGVTKKVNTIKKVFTNLTKQRPEFAWTNEHSSRVYQHAFSNLAE